ncbi:MAG: hypothetical protein A2X82_07645 [Geobacteraceae bacterium GWC2_55_20]|nr:MAG: hypothetical protein A2X82_07645 [Geobacteraceae bacterium GWC2_55_20]OGU18716.1 MAG: hypothetical protein A2X85_01355 [Geobacteraceae bacterium GWF2_54_21]
MCIWRRLTAPAVKRLRYVMSCGLTPQKLALTLCMGAALGVMPLLWGTTLICIMLAHIFRLNHVALQSVNYLLYPLQLALLVPFFKLGSWLFPWGPQLPPHMLSSLIRSSGLSSLNVFGWITLKSLTAWFVTALPAAMLAYWIFMAVASGTKGRVSGI